LCVGEAERKFVGIRRRDVNPTIGILLRARRKRKGEKGGQGATLDSPRRPSPRFPPDKM